MRALGLALLGLLLTAAPASATTYTVTGTGDAAGSCGQIVNNAASCDTLRAAVSRANQDQIADTIVLPAAPTYTLTQTPELTIGTIIAITGAGARSTTILATNTRVLDVISGGNLTLSHVALIGGKSTGSSASPAQGGDILNQGVLTLDHVRVTGGTSSAGGGGIANVGGSLTAVNSLIDGNTVSSASALGGGIASTTGSGTTVIPARVALTNTTVAFNQVAGTRTGLGGGVALTGTPSTATLTSVTIARNTATSGAGGVSPAGIYDGTGGNLGSVTTAGVIIAQNFDGSTLNNCGGLAPRDQAGVGEASLSDGGECGFARVADPQLDAALSNQGGETNVLAIPATSPAKRLVADCPVATDQRDGARQLGGACDAGAYEQITPPPPPPQPTVSPAPTPAPTATPAPRPVFHKNVVVRPVSGKVKVKLPGTNKFVDLDVTQNVKLGSTIDVRHGKIALTSVPKPGGKPQTALFYGGIFKLTQPGGTTQLRLTEPLAACSRRHHAAAAAAAKKKKPRTRSLWGDGHGAFRTEGRYSAATVRGTKWFVRDSCAGTLTRVVRGVVSVRDEVRHKTLTLRAGKKYLARPRR
jgi:hypothetical protein